MIAGSDRSSPFLTSILGDSLLPAVRFDSPDDAAPKALSAGVLRQSRRVSASSGGFAVKRSLVATVLCDTGRLLGKPLTPLGGTYA
jgi:hypothetical protein